MGTFKKVKTQFERFVTTQKPENLTSYEKKLINLISENFDEVAAVGTAQGYRASYINELINKDRDTVKDILLITENKETIDQFPIIGLISLEVESFRGFTSKENILFNRSKILIYGPNGSGKTSFCEALEFSLLGYLTEAEAKRIDTTGYITNINNEDYKVPILIGLNGDGQSIEVKPNPELFYFSFIEKNRIIDFARYSSKTESKQSNLLATLFGLDEFYTFINGFTTNISGKIPVESEKQKELDAKKINIEIHKKNIESSKGKIEALKIDKNKLTEESKLNKTFEELDVFINGSKETNSDGRIELIELELQKPTLKSYSLLSFSDLQSNILNINNLIDTFKEWDSNYENKRNEITFRKIFEAVQEFEQIITDKCPVCETPISETKINPYLNAKAKLKELEGIALIEQERMLSWEKILEMVSDFANHFEQLKEAASSFGKVINIVTPALINSLKFDLSKHEEYIKTVRSYLESIQEQKSLLLEIDEAFKTNNEKAAKETVSRAKLNSERLELRNLKVNVDDIKTKEVTYKELIKEADNELKAFEEVNKELISAADKEKSIIEENKKYVEAYYSLLQKLDIYKKQLPISLVGNLNSLTKEFYNFINQDDEKFELIEKIELPSRAGERISIWFQDNTEKRLDAMLILSEGHTRCLGLSILLAKVVQENLPFIIFDDVVNAIDDDHRGRISKLLFESEDLKRKQIIVTSHSEEYIREIENKHFTKGEYEKEVKVITFLKPENRNIDIVETETFNYLVQANDFLKMSNKKDALERCRKALENIGDLFWRKLCNDTMYDSSLTVTLRSPKARPELRTLIESIKKKFEKLNIPKFSIYLPFLNWILELEKKEKLIWNYLNKGTHEESDRDDFDIAIVNELYSELVKVDQIIKHPPIVQK